MKAFRYLATAAALAALAGCTVHQSDPPTLTGPSGLALSISVTTSPQSISQNGSDVAVVTAKAIFTDPATGQTTPKSNLLINFSTEVAGQPQDFGTLKSRTDTTKADGTASTTFTAPTMPLAGNTAPCAPLPSCTVTVVATVANATSANQAITNAQASTTILLTPPGVIAPPAFTPKAAFTFLPNSNLSVPATVAFDASASCPTDSTGACSSSGSIVSYSWSFGDGGTGSGKTITHTYNAGGNFVATLTVTSDRNISASTSQTVTVALPSAPKAAFVFSPGAPAPGQSVSFDGATSTAATGHNITQYSWNFGDGSAQASGVTVSHTFSVAGVYNVVLVVTDDTGQTSATTTGVTVK